MQLHQIRRSFVTSVVILAGGYGTRMGRDKALLEFSGDTAVRRLAHKLSSVSQDVWVARRADQEALSDLRVCLDRFPGQGPLAGLESGLAHARGEWSFVVPVDAPFVRVQLARFLIGRVAQLSGEDPLAAQAVVPTLGTRPQPLLAVYHKSCRPVIENMLLSDRRRVLDLLSALRVKYCSEIEWGEFDPERVSFQTMNTAEEYARIAAKLADGGDADET